MLKKDSLLQGLLFGLLLPGLAFLFLTGVIKGLDELIGGLPFSQNFRVRTLLLVSICANLILLQIFQIRRWSQSVRGVVLATGVYAIIWFILFGSQLM